MRRHRLLAPGTTVVRHTLLLQENMEETMPVILWLLGVPLSLIVVLALFGAF
jgi:hypothetical protein